MAPVDQRTRARWTVTGWVTAASLSTVCVVMIAVTTAADTVRGTVLGMVLSGAVATLSGAAVIAVAVSRRRRGLRGERTRALLGSAVLVWGIGQVFIGLNLTPAGQRTFGVGDIVSSQAVPILLLALMTMPRRSRLSRPALWLTVDSLILTSTFTLAVWWWLLQPALPDPARLGDSAYSSALMAAFDTGITAMTLLIWARDRRGGAPAVAIGFALQAVADISSLPAVVGERPLPWGAGAIWCVAIPLLAAGLIRYKTASVSQGGVTVLEDLGESRATLLSAVVSMTVLVLALGIPVEHRWTSISLVLCVVAVGLLLTREILDSLVRAQMVRWLGNEALRDVLTGLPNRSALTDRIRRLDLTRPWVLLTVDLDDFKQVNDLHGTEAGDELLVLVARILGEVTVSGGFVARMDGDEFGVLVAGTVDDGDRLARQLLADLRRAIRERGGAMPSVSIGVGRVLREDDDSAAWDDDLVGDGGDRGYDPLTALVESAAALRAAKEAGHDQVAHYPGAVEQARRRRMLLEHRLRGAIELGGLEMHAQPLVDLNTGRVAGFESLARWTDEVLGPVSPVEFIPVAEQTGLVTALGLFALRNTLEQARDGGLLGLDVELGVNVSPIQLRHPSFARVVSELVEEFSVNPRQLLLEVTEAILVDEDDPASAALALLADSGIQLAIDDFGTGYSALGYLRRLPVDVLKIDRSWVVASVSEARTRGIVGGVVSLAHSLGATVVMEGIEDDETARMCLDLGADIGQGWLFGRPKPWPLAAAEVTEALASPSAMTPTSGGQPA